MNRLLSLVLFAAIIPNAVFAGDTESSYSVRPGDTLWNIAAEQLGSPWCWPLIASVPDNGIDFQGTLFAGANIELPEREACDAILHPVTAGSVRTETVEFLSGVPWYAQGNTAGTYLDRRFGSESGLASYSRYDDMFEPNDQTLYRERVGDTWYVVSNGTRGQAWDYVDHVLRNDATGSVFYRARDVNGEWHLVTNEIATKLSFEPESVYLIEAFDAVIGFRSEAGTTQAASPFESWTIAADDVLPKAVDARGRVLFVAEAWEDVATRNADGEPLSLSDSTVHDARSEYWLGGERVAASVSRMVPLYSSSDAPVSLPFYFRDGAQTAFKYYGVFGDPSFDANGDLVVYSLFDVRISRLTIELP